MTKIKPLFINILTMNGSGTHLIQDLMVAMGLEQLVKEAAFWPALILARRDPKVPLAYRDSQGLPALTVVNNFHQSVRGEIPKSPLSDQEVVKTFSQILSDKGGTQLFITNRFPLIYSGDMFVDTTYGDTWTLDDRDAARATLRATTEAAGWRYREFAMIRHPVDIFISNVERFGEASSHDILKRQINEFFALVGDCRNKGMPVVRYEDICSGDMTPLMETLEGYGIPKATISKAFDVPHVGQTNRWMLSRSEAITRAALELAPLLAPNGYFFECRTGISRPWAMARKWLQKLSAEVHSANQIVNGNYLAHSAFTRHRKTIFGAVYLRLLVIWPPFWKNYEALYRDFYGTPVPMRTLADRLGYNGKYAIKGRLVALVIGLIFTGFISLAILRVAMPNWMDIFSGWFM